MNFNISPYRDTISIGTSKTRDEMALNYREHAKFLTSPEKDRIPCSHNESEANFGIISDASTDYVIKSVLGEGSFGRVVKCIKTTTRETVALKVFKDHILPFDMQHELHVLQKLKAYNADRLNFVKWNTEFTVGEHRYLEFEMLDMNLWNFLKTTRTHSLSVKEIRPILHQMATTLQFLRNEGIVHTDLKPDNIMLVDHTNQPYKVKMIDFGCALPVSMLEPEMYLQALCYRSPEVILGLPLTSAMDMWSLGNIATELYLGDVLYPANSEYEVLQQMIRTQGPLPRHLLQNGLRTEVFFEKKRGGRRCRWTLRSPQEFGQTGDTETTIDSLDDLVEAVPLCHLSEEDNKAEREDRENFVDLLKRMLHPDVNKRILPSQVLEDPFITMTDLVDRYPNSFYVKSCLEMMDVCRNQSLSSKDGSPQPSNSTTSTDSDVSHGDQPAWHFHQEHPLIQELTLAFSKLSIHEETLKELPQSLEETESTMVKVEQRSPEASSKPAEVTQHSTKVTSNTADVRSQRKRTWATFVASHTVNGLPKPDSPEKKKMRMNSPAEASPSSERSWDIFLASRIGNGAQNTGLPDRMRLKMSPPSEAPSTETTTHNKFPSSGKRSWGTYIASHVGLRPPKSGPVRKKMRVNSPAEASSSRKRSSDTFMASRIGIGAQNTGLPDRMRLKMSPPSEAPSTETMTHNKFPSSGKRSWGTYIASHVGLRPPKSGPVRKKMRVNSPAEASSSRERSSDTFMASLIGSGAQNTGSPDRKRMKTSPPSEAPSTETTTHNKFPSSGKRSWGTYIASHVGLRPPKSGPVRKKMRVNSPAEASSSRERSSDTFMASRIGIGAQNTGSPDRKRMKTSPPSEAPSTETTTHNKFPSSGKRS